MGKSKRQVSFHRALYTGVSMGVWVLLTSPCFAQNTLDPFSPDAVAPSEPNATPKAPEPKAPEIVRTPVEPERPVVKKAPEKPAVNASQITPPAPAASEVKPVVQAPPPAPVEKQVEILVPEPAPVFNVAPNPQTKDPFAPSYVISAQPQPAPASPLTAPPVQTTTVNAQETPAPSSEPVQPATKARPIASVAEESSPSFFERLGKLFSKAEPSPAPEHQSKATALAPTQQNEETPPAAETQIAPQKEDMPAPALTVSEETEQASFFDKLRNFLTPTQPSKNQDLSETTQQVTQEKPEPEPKTELEPALTQETTSHASPAAEQEDTSLLNKIGDFFSSPFSSDDKAAQTTESPAEKHSTAPAVEPTVPVQSPAPVTEAKPIDPRLVKAEFGLGADIKLGQGDNDLSKQAKCFTKNRGTIAFCTTPTRWPAPIARHFEVSTHLYKGTRAIVQYEGSVATRLYGIFKGDGFQDVLHYYENQYGPATNSFVRNTRLLNKTVENKSYIWRKENPLEGLVEIMEIRQIADTRGPNPDMDNSMIRSYFEGSREIFSQVSDLDFMHLR
ncbi:hypothetical protein GCM10011332_12260 [Terasakiella brassicae]|uniref:Uncharacterized protein n=1 Tax=Terasakiella brassicae TaxID=1634917 RepID=A0A917BX78_9PROT|nr:hypothetical protein [Terasakiella brassicae]GGF60092.1 hypothetical protein GCM10011332_12260 [Terasakiella brassicae]